MIIIATFFYVVYNELVQEAVKWYSTNQLINPKSTHVLLCDNNIQKPLGGEKNHQNVSQCLLQLCKEEPFKERKKIKKGW